MVEIDLSGLGYREIRELTTLLELYLKSDIEINNLFCGFNENSGYVYLYDGEEYTTYMENNGQLEQYYNCGNCGKDGFYEEFMHKETKKTNCHECKEMFRD